MPVQLVILFAINMILPARIWNDLSPSRVAQTHYIEVLKTVIHFTYNNICCCYYYLR